MTHTPNGEREAAEWLNMLAAQLERPSRCGMYRNIPGLSAGQVYDIAQDMRSAIALLQSPAAPANPVPQSWIEAGGMMARICDSKYGVGISFNCDEACKAFTDFYKSPAAVQQGDCLQRMAGITGRATPSPASPEVGPLDDDLQALVSERFADYLDSPAASPEVGSDALRDFVEERDASGETTGYFLFGDAAANTPPPEVGGLVDAAMRERIRQASYAAHSPDDGMGDYADKVIDATLAALAPTRQAGGEAVAWLFEMEEYGEWITRLALSREAGTGHNCRNVRPLYTRPAPSAESAFVRVPAAKLVRAAELAESDGDEHGIGRVLRDLVASAPERAP